MEVGTEGKVVIAVSENGTLHGLDVRASEEVNHHIRCMLCMLEMSGTDTHTDLLYVRPFSGSRIKQLHCALAHTRLSTLS